MKKIRTNFFIIMFSVLFVSTTGFAQNVIKGTVVDRKGNPVVGTKITMKSGAVVTTDFDGRFEIEGVKGDRAVANCVGMQEKKFGLKPDMVVKLKKTTGWNRKPSKYSPFITLNGAYIGGHHNDVPGVGIMGGIVKSVGLYGKVIISVDDITGKTRTISDVNSANKSYFWTNGDRTSGYRQFAVGGIVRLGCPLHFCLGAGLFSYKECCALVPDAAGNTNRIAYSKGVAALVDFGWLLSFKHFTMGLTGSVAPSGAGGSFSLGLGYKF